MKVRTKVIDLYIGSRLANIFSDNSCPGEEVKTQWWKLVVNCVRTYFVLVLRKVFKFCDVCFCRHNKVTIGHRWLLYE